ncbi:RNA polymerase sigma factor [Spirosoma endophyticum]|uniref:RNA polymerase sigma factor, sigma-70 family n=1 Tax=Spirosoma endophyticum TaxID=662367 RepID=A0A1I2FD84_9BACT|nr:sigma-70 family RNA polymerase sigma factor [Spirosoma endophyticum]SFF03195.1 RNA polymerase sigma factor, sigma-70 family [Spirosoma endophyticum]
MKQEDKVPNELMDEADEDLLVIMSMKDDPSNRVKAYKEFYRRYAPFLSNYIKKIVGKQLTIPEQMDMVYRTFTIVYEKSDGFDTRGQKDVDKIRIQIRGWLGRIIKNVFLTYLKEEWKVPWENIDPLIEYSAETTEAEEAPVTYKRQLLDEALEQLSERDREMVLTYYQFYEKGAGNQSLNIPKEVLDPLCKYHKTTTTYFRQIVKRGREKVENYVKSHYQPHLDKSHVQRK